MTTLEFDDVWVRYGSGRAMHDVVRGLSLTVPSGCILGLVGESGSGKSTLARAVVGLHEPSSGRILIDGTNVANARGPAAVLRLSVQMIFQDPNSCMNPRMTVGDSIEEAFAARDQRKRAQSTAASRRRSTAELLHLVDLDPARSRDLPSRLSGGQRQRVALARALASEPSVLLADEITSALDVSVQGSVLNLLRNVQQSLGLTVLFISHNLAVVRQLCDEVAVMKDGELVEHGPAAQVIDNPRDPYTRDLVGAIPRIGKPLFDEEGATP